MAFDEKLADRIRAVLSTHADVTERRMFGGIAFMVGDHMSCGVVGSSLMVRVNPDDGERLLQEPHARPMDFTGRPMRGFLYVDPPGIKTLASLGTWIRRATTWAESQPPKTRGRRSASKPGRSAVSIAGGRS
jgi:TfoX/Sxy family transcriptional regulator of competence genes